MGMWLGDDYFVSCYDYFIEYVQVFCDLWGIGCSDFKGDYFIMNDCWVSLCLLQLMKVICVGQSDVGMVFFVQYVDYNFCFGKGVNMLMVFVLIVVCMMQVVEKIGCDVGFYVLFMVIVDEIDEVVCVKWEYYKGGVDEEVLVWFIEQSQKDICFGSDINVCQMVDFILVVNINMGILVGLYVSVVCMFDEVVSVFGIDGVLLIFDDFFVGIDVFGECIQLLMCCWNYIVFVICEVV